MCGRVAATKNEITQRSSNLCPGACARQAYECLRASGGGAGCVAAFINRFTRHFSDHSSRPRVGRKHVEDSARYSGSSWMKPRKVSARGARQKGSRFEREVVAQLRAAGIVAHRVPLSGAAGGIYSGDVHAEIGGRSRKIECKSRGRAWKDLYDYLDGNWALIVKRDHAEPLVVLPMATFTELVGEEW